VSIHEEFRALSAISTSGCLSEEEQRRLEAHLAVCAECREIARAYETVAGVAIPSLVSEFPEQVECVPPGWSAEATKRELFRRLELRGEQVPDHDPFASSAVPRTTRDHVGRRQRDIWARVTQSYLPYAAGVAVVLAAGAVGYRMGGRQPETTPAHGTQPLAQSQIELARPEIASALKERDLLRAQLEERDHAIGNLNGKVGRQVAEVQELKGADQDLRESLQTAQSQSTQTASERDELSRKLERSQSDLVSMQKDLESLHQQRAEQALRVANLESQAGKLPGMLKDRDDTIEQQRELLDRDRDIRDLMGARDLYIAEVFDVGRDGQTKKPFGRVFYTKGKSLIFYAYDLDQQPGLREASTFQAWGRRGPDLTQSTNLGIFYVDNTSHKRWVLKFNDPKSLEQIDAVFVTVEPKGGSRKPSGKQLLFAYLRVEPNHP
jgi:hypothetical protein